MNTNDNHDQEGNDGDSHHTNDQEQQQVSESLQQGEVTDPSGTAVEDGNGEHVTTHESPIESAEPEHNNACDDSSAKSPPHVKDTIASKKRYNLQHGACENSAHSTSDYVTPLQRREQLVKELKAQVKDLQKTIDQKEAWWKEQAAQKDKMAEIQMSENNDRINKLTAEIEALRCTLTDDSAGMEETRETIASLHLAIKKLQDDIEKKEKQHQQLYLEMYLKGKNAAIFERMEEIERLAIQNPQSVTIRELLEKLMNTEHELEKWQSIKRDETYQGFAKPQTEPEVTLSFLKDAMLHYITDIKDSDEHLRAIIEIFDYSDEEKAKIHAALVARRKRGK